MTGGAEITASDGTVTQVTTGPVVTLTIDRPAKLNALTPELLATMASLLRGVAQSDARVVVLRSAGDRAFCVGADVTRFAGLSPTAMWRDWTRLGHQVFDLIAGLPQITVAVLQGDAFGGGLELALSADFRIVATHARLGLPEVRLGTVPGWGGTQRLTQLVGAARAKLVCVAGRPLSAQEAERQGLASVVAEAADLDAALDALVVDIVAGAPIATVLAKQLIDGAALGVPARLVEPLAGALSASTVDLAEGVAAFRERRPAQFLGQ